MHTVKELMPAEFAPTDILGDDIDVTPYKLTDVDPPVVDAVPLLIATTATDNVFLAAVPPIFTETVYVPTFMLAMLHVRDMPVLLATVQGVDPTVTLICHTCQKLFLYLVVDGMYLRQIRWYRNIRPSVSTRRTPSLWKSMRYMRLRSPPEGKVW